jgi:hypothetical protein
MQPDFKYQQNTLSFNQALDHYRNSQQVIDTVQEQLFEDTPQVTFVKNRVEDTANKSECKVSKDTFYSP